MGTGCCCCRHRWNPYGWKEAPIHGRRSRATRLEAHGIPVVLATGNVRAITYGLWRFLGLTGPICCENGGVLWHPKWKGPVVRASGKEARKAAEWLAGEIQGLDSQGIETNQWRESEWCLFPYEDLDAVNEAMARSEWKHLDVVRTGFAIHLMEPHLSKGHGLTELFERMNWSPSWSTLCWRRPQRSVDV